MNLKPVVGYIVGSKPAWAREWHVLLKYLKARTKPTALHSIKHQSCTRKNRERRTRKNGWIWLEEEKHPRWREAVGTERHIRMGKDKRQLGKNMKGADVVERRGWNYQSLETHDRKGWSKGCKDTSGPRLQGRVDGRNASQLEDEVRVGGESLSPSNH